MDLRYPIGKFTRPESFSPNEIRQWIRQMEELPEKMKAAVAGMTDVQLDTPYREGGWTVRQVVHHVVDSHINCYIRIKLALTEDNPVIKPYREELWAELPEAKTAPVELSLPLLETLHKRMILMLNNLSVADLDRTFYHPENKTTSPVKAVIALYAWHGNHHLAHITELKKRMGW